VRQARDEWKAHRQPRMREAVHRLVFLDETGTTTKMTRLRGRARRGARLKADAPFGHWATQTFIAGLRCDGLTAPWVIDHPMNRETFDTYVETQLAPTLHRNSGAITRAIRDVFEEKSADYEGNDRATPSLSDLVRPSLGRFLSRCLPGVRGSQSIRSTRDPTQGPWPRLVCFAWPRVQPGQAGGLTGQMT